MINKNKFKDSELDKSKIPLGMYCHGSYDEIDHKYSYICPYWDLDSEKPHQENGYCHFMKEGDWEVPGVSLLWYTCKECSINWEYPNEKE